jgi:histidine triad (HIT) family protein
MDDCIFCEIIAGELPSTKVYEDDEIVAFLDIQPMAPVHVLIIPKAHIRDMNALTADNTAVVSHIFAVIPKIAAAQGIAESGYRVACNCGPDSWGAVDHLHFHLLGGQKMSKSLA